MPRKPFAVKRSVFVNLALYPTEMSEYERATRLLGFRKVQDYIRHAAYAFAKGLPAVVEGASTPQETTARLMAVNHNLTAGLAPSKALPAKSHGANTLTERGREMASNVSKNRRD